MEKKDFSSTKDVKIPKDPIERVIGQDNAVEKIKLAVKQKRNLLLVGPPGVGKSMLAKTIAYYLPEPKEQMVVLDNPQNPNKPIIKTLDKQAISEEEKKRQESFGKIAEPEEVPTYVTERLGFRCVTCGDLSDPQEKICPVCGEDKHKKIAQSRRPTVYGDLITEVLEIQPGEPEREVQTTRINQAGEEEVVIYQRLANNKIRVLDQKTIDELRRQRRQKRFTVLVPLDRKTFVRATGASETELLGDVRHDPYGSHPEIGTPAYQRVVAGAIHEAHEGVLFIDELPQLGSLQTYILTAMQDKKFPITGRNPQSAGASVKVEDVSCNFLFVGACNIREIQNILPPLRSRIIGDGYEILLDTTMPDSEENRVKMSQFIAQEIELDGRIPHATNEAVNTVLEEARKRALEFDNMRDALTLRLRDLGGVVRMAGDYAVQEESKLIEKKHVIKSIRESRSIEHQLKEKYGSVWEGMKRDESVIAGLADRDKSYL